MADEAITVLDGLGASAVTAAVRRAADPATG
jgi:hypothetical protein